VPTGNKHGTSYQGETQHAHQNRERSLVEWLFSAREQSTLLSSRRRGKKGSYRVEVLHAHKNA
jgi:hypothetical protein